MKVRHLRGWRLPGTHVTEDGIESTDERVHTRDECNLLRPAGLQEPLISDSKVRLNRTAATVAMNSAARTGPRPPAVVLARE
jgi:hypothetical protein